VNGLQSLIRPKHGTGAHNETIVCTDYAGEKTGNTAALPGDDYPSRGSRSDPEKLRKHMNYLAFIEHEQNVCEPCEKLVKRREIHSRAPKSNYFFETGHNLEGR
jgi:hypothetical protein